MVLIYETVHPKSLNFANQRKVVILRDVHQMAFHAIRLQVWNLQKRHPSKDLVRRVYQDCTGTSGVRKFQYGKCGRKAWKVDAQLRAFVVKRLLALRMKCICTSTTLQREVAKTLRKQVGASTIRKILLKAGRLEGAVVILVVVWTATKCQHECHSGCIVTVSIDVNVCIVVIVVVIAP